MPDAETCSSLPGGVTAPSGFRAAGIHAGIKAKAADLALLVSDIAATIAGVFTTNRIQGAHIGLCKKHLTQAAFRAVLINSGSANACTGEQGKRDALTSAEAVAESLGVPVTSVFVCSTGTIGKPLPMDRIQNGILKLTPALSATGGPDAARAIMTTDTRPKEAAISIKTSTGRTVTIGGMAKGAGMIEPNMATMLAFVTTDAHMAPPDLQQALNTAVSQSFNRISIDGEQSCNDTVLLIANGHSEASLSPASPDWPLFQNALNTVCRTLAREIVADGEGATRFVTVTVSGAPTPADALTAARAIANSKLVKTAWFGSDPNWGRIINAAGYSGASFDPDRVDIRFDQTLVVEKGMKVPGLDLKRLSEIFSQKSFSVNVHLHSGPHEDTVYTCDLSYDYVKINAEYMT